jgi:hypothetical protein
VGLTAGLAVLAAFATTDSQTLTIVDPEAPITDGFHMGEWRIANFRILILPVLSMR